MATENWHKQLKHDDEQDVRAMIRLDKLMNVLCEQLIKATTIYVHQLLKNPATRRTGIVRDDHKRSIEIQQNVVAVNDSEWSFPGTSATGAVVKWIGGCSDYVSCLKCPVCKICIHLLYCSYPRYKLGFICKHTHAVKLANPHLSLPIVTAQDKKIELMARHALRPGQTRRAEEIPPAVMDVQHDEVSTVFATDQDIEIITEQDANIVSDDLI